MIKLLYVLAIGLLFAAFVGLGFDAFYPGPKAPEYPETLMTVKTAEEMTSQEKITRDEDEKQFRTTQKSFDADFKTYNMRLSIGLIVVSLVILAISILGLGKIDVLGDGLTLGGVFVLFYGLIRSFMGGDEKVRFIAVTVGLVTIGLLTWWKYVRKPKPVI